MTETIIIPLGLYAFLLLIAWLAWLRYPTLKKPAVMERAFSVIVPFRNEEANLPRLIESFKKLNYQSFELLLVNDQSNDNSVLLAEKYLQNARIDYTLINNADGVGSPKKRAITEALKVSKYNFIACTDADCEVPTDWLSYINAAFETSESIQFVSGPVAFFDADTSSSLWRKLWNKVQQVEFASLIGSGACSMILGFPNMCSGANIAYKKEAFEAVGGYEGNTHLASGDDEFLLHKIAVRFPNSIAYLKNSKAVVYTEDQPNFSSFFQQRKRWASKWSFYKNLSPKLVAIFIFVVNLLTIAAMVKGLWLLFAMRAIAEFTFLATFLSFFRQPKAIFYIIPLQFIYPFYAVIFGLNSLRSTSYLWKDRSLT